MRKFPQTVRKYKNKQQKRRCPCSTPLYLKVNDEEMHSPGKLAQVGMVENVHSTRMKREFCKPAIKSDRNTTPEKNFVTEMTRDGDDILNLKPLQFYKYQQYRCVKFPQKLRGTYSVKKKVVAIYVSFLYVY